MLANIYLKNNNSKQQIIKSPFAEGLFIITIFFSLYSITYVDSLDWKNLGVRPIIDRVLYNGDLKNGAIILMHNGADYTPQALETVIQGILSRGYQIIPVSELIYTRNYQLDRLGIQHSTAPVETVQ